MWAVDLYSTPTSNDLSTPSSTITHYTTLDNDTKITMSDSRKSNANGCKSRFSLLSLLPARHPPLVISHPAPPLPTQQVHRGLPELRTNKTRIESSYGLTDDVSHYSPGDKQGSKKWTAPESPVSPVRRKHRPPPLDLSKTRRHFPTVKGVTLVREVSPPPVVSSPGSPTEAKGSLPKRDQSLPIVRGPTDLKKSSSKVGQLFKGSENNILNSNNNVEKKPSRALKPKPSAHDTYDFVSLESEHQYPSWKGGKVDIRPGEHIPADLVGLRKETQRGIKPSRSVPGLARKDNMTPSPDGDQYESVLHNVLLTPTYFAPSTASKSTTDLVGGKDRSKRQTLLDRASRWGRDVLGSVPAVGGSLAQYGRSNHDRAREEREMDEVRFKKSRVPVPDITPTRTRRERALSSASSLSTPSPAIRGVVGTPYRRSPAWTNMREREESIGFDRGTDIKDESTGTNGKRPLVGINSSWQADGKRSVSVSEAWREKKKKEQDIKRKRLMWRVSHLPLPRSVDR